MRQACLANKDMLKASTSVNPKPPLAFESHIDVQDTQCNFLSYALWPHQKFAMIVLISLQRVEGNQKQDIV